MNNEKYNYEEPYLVPNGGANEEISTQSIMAKAFLFMFVALLLSGAAAYMAIDSGFMYSMLTNNTYYALIIVELIVVFAAGATLKRNLVLPSAFLFAVYSVVNGVTLSVIFMAYTQGSIYYMFIIAAVIFAIMAVIGFVTKKDLTALGTLGLMGLVGIIVLSVVNIFILKNNQFDLVLSALGLAIFIGLTAYDTQKIKNMAASRREYSDNTIAMFGALVLYLDFINMFLHLLRLFGRRR